MPTALSKEVISRARLSKIRNTCCGSKAVPPRMTMKGCDFVVASMSLRYWSKPVCSLRKYNETIDVHENTGNNCWHSQVFKYTLSLNGHYPLRGQQQEYHLLLQNVEDYLNWHFVDCGFYYICFWFDPITKKDVFFGLLLFLFTHNLNLVFVNPPYLQIECQWTLRKLLRTKPFHLLSFFDLGRALEV